VAKTGIFPIFHGFGGCPVEVKAAEAAGHAAASNAKGHGPATWLLVAHPAGFPPSLSLASC